ncbi:MAG: HPt (histidine-containing phosphotransfer) domain-containing protein [Bacteriovoracaceae bacterium]|jgi:HPt (histidine-containing phosphotransfer) domain-containing protein
MIINKEKTLSAFADDEDIFFSIIDEFINNFENQKNELISTLDKKNTDEIRICVHTIKGLSATFYFEPLRSIAAEAEAAAKEGKLEVVDQLREELISKFDELYKDARRISNEQG